MRPRVPRPRGDHRSTLWTGALMAYLVIAEGRRSRGARSGARHRRQGQIYLTATVAAHRQSGPCRAWGTANKPGRGNANPMTQRKRFVNRRVKLRRAKSEDAARERGPRNMTGVLQLRTWDRPRPGELRSSAARSRGNGMLPALVPIR